MSYEKLFDLTKRVALIVGAAGGLAGETCLGLAEFGATIGFNLFYMKAIVPKSITMTDIYESVVPFVGLQALCLLTCILFPEIILWLPQHIIK